MTDRPANTREETRARALSWPGVLDGLVLFVLISTASLGLSAAWGSLGFLRAAIGGLVGGLVVAWVSAWQRWGAVRTLAVTTLVYFLVGGAFAFPGTAIGGVLPTPTTWSRLAIGMVEGWMDFVTTVPPLDSFPDLAVVPLALCYLTAVVAGTVAWRARHAVWALVPVVAATTLMALLGTIVETYPVVQGLAVAVIGVLWASWRATDERHGARSVMSARSRTFAERRRWQQLAAGALVLGLTGTMAAFAAPHVVDGERLALREVITPPLDLYEFTSPLVSFRKYAKDQAETELFTVEGLRDGDRVRIAALDRYSGVVYDASSGAGGGVYHRVGDSRESLAPGERYRVSFTFSGYSGAWLPLVRELTAIEYGGSRVQELATTTYYNPEAWSALATAGVGAGDSVELEVVERTSPTEEQLRVTPVADIDLPEPLDVPEAAPAKAQQFVADAPTRYDEIVAIRAALESTGIRSSGLENQAPSRAGHSTARLDEMLAQVEMVGDDEQFASVYALMLRQREIPARVVMGFVPDPEAWVPGSPYVAVGEDVRAWVEVPFEGLGWVPFDVQPDEDNKIEPEPQSQEIPKPPVLESPEKPEEPPEPEAADIDEEEREEDDAAVFDWRQVVIVAAAVTIPLGLLASPFLLALVYKTVRGRRRRASADVLDRVSGGWREVVDAATDLGAGVPRGATRRESAELVAAQLGDDGGTMLLAEGADHAVFAGTATSDEVAQAYWEHVDEVVGSMRAAVPWQRRVAARVSWRSVRGADTPSPRRSVRERVRAVGPALRTLTAAGVRSMRRQH
ncbi:transglutaminase domain-containing protein [Isoptericola croceus]|uniref:transglutaminase domain-containing protein n=1 Tax=Isoptericola croceus TaxID=3031406 RepID=UPI0023F63EBF|nr:transglutaminase domain-containing protein [Isoptericola croceus]